MELREARMESMVNNNFWLDRRVFVTGASGLVGSWLVKELLRLQCDVVILMRDWVPHSVLFGDGLLQQVTCVRGDLSQPNFLERVLAEYEIKTVFHLAAQTIVPIANNNPLSTFESNIAGTWNLLEACRRCKRVEQIVIASSDKAYGDVTDLPYREDTPLKAIYPYDVSKACADMIATSYAKTWNLPVTITRCGNFFGGGDLNWNRIVPGTIRSIIRNQQPIIRSNGQLVRDYVYVEDAVSAYITLAHRMSQDSGLIGSAFNFSNNNPLSVLQIVTKIIHSMNSALQPIILNEATAEIQDQYLDASKAHHLLDWKPVFGVDEGLIKTVNWYQSFFRDKEPHGV